MKYLTLASLAVSTLVAGCVTILESEQVPADGTGDAVAGIRYSLPQPFLLVTPKTDGTIDVETVLLPDAARTYAITQKSFLGSHTLNVQIEQGLLKAIDFGSDASATATKLVEGYGEWKKATIETEAAQAKAASDAVKAAKQKVVDMQAAQAKAKAVVEYLEPYLKAHPGDADATKALLAAQVELQKANADLQAAQDAALVLGIDSFNAPGVAADSGATAYGPLLYRVVQTAAASGKSAAVDLVAVEYAIGAGSSHPGQLNFPTSMLGLPAPEQPAELAFTHRAVLLARNIRRIDVTTTVPVEGIDASQTRFYSIDAAGNTTPVGSNPQTVLETKRDIAIMLPSGLTPGEYRFVVMFVLDKDGRKKDKTDLAITIAP